MKKYFIYLLIFVLLLSGCSQKEEQDHKKQFYIAVSLYNQSDTFIAELASYLKGFAREHEAVSEDKVIVDIYDAQGSQTLQNKQFDEFIKRRYDAFCVNLVDRTAASDFINKAKKEDTPLVFFNREPVQSDMDLWNRVYYVGSDSKNSGYLEGKLIANAYQKDRKQIDRNHDGVIQYAMLEGEQGHQDALIRSETCLYAMQEANIPLENMVSVTANWRKSQGEQQTKNILDTYGDTIEVIFSNNDEMALGAIAAIKEKGYHTKVVGVDGTDEALEAIKKNELMGTVLNDGRSQANEIFQLAYQSAKGTIIHEDKRKIYTPSIMIDTDNVDKIITLKKENK